LEAEMEEAAVAVTAKTVTAAAVITAVEGTEMIETAAAMIEVAAAVTAKTK
jgi:hypothetical protein